MATALEGTDEGKTTNVHQDESSLCDACENAQATQYCLMCPGPLCDQCANSHMKSKLTKNHTVVQVGTELSSETQSDRLPGLSKCTKHPDEELEHFCENCVCFICKDCEEEDHENHSVQPAKANISVYQNVHHFHSKALLGGTHDLEKYKRVLENVIEEYEKACVMVDVCEEDFIKTIRESAQNLRQLLRNVQGKLKTQLGDANNGLIKEINTTDRAFTALQNYRKVEDCEVLSCVLESSRTVLGSLKDYTRKITPKVKPVTAGQILPYHKESESLKGDIRIFFSDETPRLKSVANSTDFAKRCVQLQVGESGQRYRLCKVPVDDGILIHGERGSDVRLLDSNLNETKQKGVGFEVENLVSVYRNELVALQKRRSGVYRDLPDKISLLDADFNVVLTKEYESAVYARSICYLSPHRFILFSTKNNAAYLTTTLVKGKSFIREQRLQLNGLNGKSAPLYMDLHPDKNSVYVGPGGGKDLCKVNLENGDVTKYDMPEVQGKHGRTRISPTSLFVDDDGNFIVGDCSGKIFKLDEQMNPVCIAETDNGYDKDLDLLVKDGRLIVLSNKNKISMFY